MKALQVDTYGDPSHFSIHTDVQVPELKPNQLRIAVKAVSINPFDITVSSGAMKDMMPLTLPYTIGGDFSGVVEEIGADVSGFTPGDEVFGQAVVLNGGSGSFAEHVVANAANTAHKPKTIDFLKSASLPLAGSSAVQALEKHIGLSNGQRILIHGGAGGIGSLAIQIAKIHGAYVATTASGEGLAFVKSLGADEVIDYKTQKFEEIIKDYDAVFDTVGGPTTNASLSVLKKGGILVTMIGQPDEAKAASLGVTAVRQMTQTTTEHLTRLAQLVDENHVKPVIDKVMQFTEAKEAFVYFIEGHPKGKVVIHVSD
jgi:NADPH:quinone reductase-like Zn-dependent oxidoreductase